jgi:hypothetical protein
MLAYERASWTDEHLNSVPPKDQFELPEVEGGHSRWRWVQGSEWKIEVGDKDSKSLKNVSAEEAGWIYYDNKVGLRAHYAQLRTKCHQWRDGRRGQDGWGRYTRRRKWYRDAELVEATPSTEVTPVPTPKYNPIEDTADPDPNHLARLSSNLSVPSSTEPTLVDDHEYAASVVSDTDGASTKSKRSWFKKKRSKSTSGSVSNATIASSTSTNVSQRSDEDDLHSPLERTVREDEWRLGDDIRQHLDI